MGRRDDASGRGEVPVRELKARLSEYLRAVHAGQELTVTAHGRPIARLVPVASCGGGLVIREPLVRGRLGDVPRPPLKKRVSNAHLRRLLDADRNE
jgi:prevent-host-death family protein